MEIKYRLGCSRILIATQGEWPTTPMLYMWQGKGFLWILNTVDTAFLIIPHDMFLQKKDAIGVCGRYRHFFEASTCPIIATAKNMVGRRTASNRLPKDRNLFIMEINRSRTGSWVYWVNDFRVAGFIRFIRLCKKTFTTILQRFAKFCKTQWLSRGGVGVRSAVINQQLSGI